MNAKEAAELAFAKETINVMQDREQAWLANATAVADRLKSVVGTLPLNIEACEGAAITLQAMSRAMTNDVLKTMLRDSAHAIERYNEVLKPRLEALRAAADSFRELTAGQTIENYKPKSSEARL